MFYVLFYYQGPAWAENYRAVRYHNSALSIVTATPTVKTLILCQNCFIELNYPGKFKTNAIAPLMFSREMLPFLKKAADNSSMESLIVNMSSILGSVELNHPESGGGSGGGIYPYRSSKAALNMITRSLSLDLKHLNTKAVAIHPGWVKTEMGGSHAPLTTEKSIFGVLSVINNFSSESHNGKLIDYTGKILPFSPDVSLKMQK